jgi:shikimate dehydrogenase
MTTKGSATKGSTSATRTLALLGDPVGHSFSPAMQSAAFEVAGLDAVYVALRCDGEDLAGLVRGIAGAGGGGNITIPHKEPAARIVEVPSEAVRRTGACNCFWLKDGKIHGDNTDVEGFRRALSTVSPGPHVGMDVLLLGAGGAARAVLTALLDEGVKEVVFLNRSVERARAVARRIGGDRVRVLQTPDEASGRDFDLVVNATSLGLDAEDSAPVNLREVGSVGAVMDLVYGLRPTQLLEMAAELGIPAVDGRAMLLHQGAVAFERWWPDHEAPIDVMEQALQAAIRG